MKQALAIYADVSDDSELPIKDKAQLKEELLMAIMEVRDALTSQDIDLEKIRINRDVFERTALKEEAVEAILINDTSKKEFLRMAAVVNRLYKAYLPDPIEAETAETAYLIRKIAKQIRSMQPDVDVSDVMHQVEELLDKSVSGFDIEEPEDGVPIYNLSDVDFDKLKKGFDYRLLLLQQLIQHFLQEKQFRSNYLFQLWLNLPKEKKMIGKIFILTLILQKDLLKTLI